MQKNRGKEERRKGGKEERRKGGKENNRVIYYAISAISLHSD